MSQWNYAHDENAFLFSVTTDDASLRQFRINRGAAVHPQWGPTFFNDFRIGRLPSQTLEEGMCWPYKYEPTDGGGYDKATLGGSLIEWFALDEIELLRVGDE